MAFYVVLFYCAQSLGGIVDLIFYENNKGI